MTDYRRHRVPGGTYFFTVNLADRRGDLCVRHIDILRAAVRNTRAVAPFHIDAWVVLPDHMHCIWTLPENDTDFSNRWRMIKAGFFRNIPGGEMRSASRVMKGERGIWQRRFWEHVIRDEHDYRTHMDYIHFNPVKHGLAESAASWSYSSFHRCVRAGLYPVDWANGTELSDAGERTGQDGWSAAQPITGGAVGERRWVTLRSTHPTACCSRPTTVVGWSWR